MPPTRASWFLVQGQYQSQQMCFIFLTSENYLDKVGEAKSMFLCKNFDFICSTIYISKTHWNLCGVQFCPEYIQWKVIRIYAS